MERNGIFGENKESSKNFGVNPEVRDIPNESAADLDLRLKDFWQDRGVLEEVESLKAADTKVMEFSRKRSLSEFKAYFGLSLLTELGEWLEKDGCLDRVMTILTDLFDFLDVIYTNAGEDLALEPLCTLDKIWYNPEAQLPLKVDLDEWAGQDGGRDTDKIWVQAWVRWLASELDMQKDRMQLQTIVSMIWDILPGLSVGNLTPEQCESLQTALVEKILELSREVSTEKFAVFLNWLIPGCPTDGFKESSAEDQSVSLGSQFENGGLRFTGFVDSLGNKWSWLSSVAMTWADMYLVLQSKQDQGQEEVEYRERLQSWVEDLDKFENQYKDLPQKLAQNIEDQDLMLEIESEKAFGQLLREILIVFIKRHIWVWTRGVLPEDVNFQGNTGLLQITEVLKACQGYGLSKSYEEHLPNPMLTMEGAMDLETVKQKHESLSRYLLEYMVLPTPKLQGICQDLA